MQQQHNKRSRGWLLVTLLVTLLVIFCPAGAPGHGMPQGQPGGAGCEVRGVWLNPPAFDTPAVRAETLSKITSGNINTAFLLAPPVGAFRGWSDPEDFEVMLSALDAVGVSTHIWVAVMYRVSGAEADFRDPAEQDAQVAWADALLRAYPLADGYHLDYIRYTGVTPINEEGKMDGVSQTVDRIGEHIQGHFPKRHLTAAVFRASAWAADFDTEDIPQWFRSWYAAHPGNPYDHPDPWFTSTVPFHFKKQQDPVGWMAASPITGVMPMEYCTSDSWWQAEVDHWGLFMADQGLAMARIFMGVGWLDTEWSDYDAPAVVRKINYGRAHGVGGFVIFELGNPAADDGPLINALAVDGPDNDYNAPYGEWTPSCLSIRDLYLPWVAGP